LNAEGKINAHRATFSDQHMHQHARLQDGGGTTSVTYTKVDIAQLVRIVWNQTWQRQELCTELR